MTMKNGICRQSSLSYIVKSGSQSLTKYLFSEDLLLREIYSDALSLISRFSSLYSLLQKVNYPSWISILKLNSLLSDLRTSSMVGSSKVSLLPNRNSMRLLRHLIRRESMMQCTLMYSSTSICVSKCPSWISLRKLHSISVQKSLDGYGSYRVTVVSSRIESISSMNKREVYFFWRRQRQKALMTPSALLALHWMWMFSLGRPGVCMFA